MGWSRACTVVSWEPSRELAYRTSGGAAFADSTEWRFTLTPAHHDRLAALRADLGRLAVIAEAETTTKIKIKDEAERAWQLLT
jgi:hypothetical protein